MDQNQMSFAYDRRRTSTLTLDEQPGAHTGVTRKYIPGYSDANIIFRAPTTGNDANDGLTEGAPKLSQSSSETAAGTTKKIRIIENCTISDSITKPTEMKRGFTGTLSSSVVTALDTFSDAATPSYAGSTVFAITWASHLSLFISGGENGKLATSPDGDTWTQVVSTGFGSSIIRGLAYSPELGLIVAIGTNEIGYSTDGENWTVSDGYTTLSSILWDGSKFIICTLDNTASGGLVSVGATYTSEDGLTWVKKIFNNTFNFFEMAYSPDLPMYVATNSTYDNTAYYSSDGENWTQVTNPGFGTDICLTVSYSQPLEIFILAGESGKIAYSADGTSWTLAATPAFTNTETIQCARWIGEISRFVAGTSTTGAEIAFSSDGNIWTLATTSGTNWEKAYSVSYGATAQRLVFAGDSSLGNGAFTRSSAYTVTISAPIAGFTVNNVLYSGTVISYNCTSDYIATTAALSLDNCRINYDSHISNSLVTSRATLYKGDRYLTCTPVNTNDIDMNLDTVGGTWYIYNASQTGYERIRDCIVEGGIVASFPVTVSGRANTRGTSENVMFGATVTHNDPKFVNTTDYQLQFQTNGYSKNSPAAGRSALYFNSAGNSRDIGAWSYIESNVSYFYAKNRYLFKGEISHGLEFNLTEQQGDSGVINVYGNVNRLKEVLTIQYGDTRPIERAVFDEMLLLTDKSVKIAIDFEWTENSGTVTVNGNQSAGVEYLTVDAVATFNGMTVTIAGKQYLVMRSSPNTTAATRLILDRPTEDAVSDNDVLVTNYPSGQGEYQFAGPTNLVLKRKAPTSLTGWQTGFAIRLVRKKQ